MPCNKNISRGCCFSRNPQDNTPEVSSLVGAQKLEVYDWLSFVPNPLRENNLYEVQFKNTRKSFYENTSNLPLKKGDVVVVESQIGYDIGVITMCSDLVLKQMKRTGFKLKDEAYKKILRTPNTLDIEKWQDAIAMEHQTMIRSRQISADMKLDMKIGDVEYQADKAKAIFYYIADGRVDFRELIKVFAEQFRVRIEMKQIGARQEAGRIGGIAACGRELCCATWQNNFSSVSINAARVQDITPNPQKLAGQCGKLKCCLNYEMDSYIDARNTLPRVNQPLETMDANYFLVKTDPLRGIMYFSSDPRNPALQIPLTQDKVRQIMAANRRGEKIDNLNSYSIALQSTRQSEPELENVVGQDSLTRFDKQKRANNNNRRRNNNNNKGGRRSEDGSQTQAGENQNPNNNNAQSQQQPRAQQQPREPRIASAEQNGENPNNNNRPNNNNNRRRPNRPNRPNQNRGENPNNNNNGENRVVNESRPPREPRQPREPRAQQQEPRENKENNKNNG